MAIFFLPFPTPLCPPQRLPLGVPCMAGPGSTEALERTLPWLPRFEKRTAPFSFFQSAPICIFVFARVFLSSAVVNSSPERRCFLPLYASLTQILSGGG